VDDAVVGAFVGPGGSAPSVPPSGVDVALLAETFGASTSSAHAMCGPPIAEPMQGDRERPHAADVLCTAHDGHAPGGINDGVRLLAG
ncbi:MAG: hypothetical protein JWR34_1215, partial [Mycobacterium sp.]|nr:hypothetical protein [Mycobacterium sp.]